MNIGLGKKIIKSLGRIVCLLILVAGILGITYSLWSPGMTITDGRHDLKSNGLWISHGWLGHGIWFKRYEKDAADFHDPQKIADLKAELTEHHMVDVYPHLCPCESGGRIDRVNDEQTQRFLDVFEGMRVMPWVGGVLGNHCHPEDAVWRQRFIDSIVQLLNRHPRLAGIHINIEPLPSGNPDFLVLLEELCSALPRDKLLSIAAYPPPTIWHRCDEVHWEEAYFRAVAQRCDQMVVMMYDTALTYPKLYTNLMKQWTVEVIEWSDDTQVLLGLPAYEDAGVGYHDPAVENLEHALKGIHAGLASFNTLPMGNDSGQVASSSEQLFSSLNRSGNQQTFASFAILCALAVKGVALAAPFTADMLRV